MGDFGPMLGQARHFNVYPPMRPAVAKDMDKLEDVVEGFDEGTWSASFGAEQYKHR
jgi:hypothetical protein